MFSFIELLFNGVWALYQIKFPGTDMTIGSIAIGAVVVVISLKLLGIITGLNFSVSGFLKSVSGEEVKGGNNKKIKVSKERSGDSH